jgi:polyribonucleotide nucleotidyltransferase
VPGAGGARAYAARAQAAGRGASCIAAASPVAASAQAGGAAPPEAECCSFRMGASVVTLETGKIGRQANGAVMAREGESALYTTICSADAPAADSSFLPLTVVYQERYSAAGRSASGYVKRDGKQRDSEVLVSRLVDRPLRPVFPDGYCCETQVLQLVLAYGGERTPDALAITAAGAALVVSDIPSSKPVAGVRVGWPRASPVPVVNPTIAEARRLRAAGRACALHADTHSTPCRRRWRTASWTW